MNSAFCGEQLKTFKPFRSYACARVCLGNYHSASLATAIPPSYSSSFPTAPTYCVLNSVLSLITTAMKWLLFCPHSTNKKIEKLRHRGVRYLPQDHLVESLPHPYTQGCKANGPGSGWGWGGCRNTKMVSKGGRMCD